MKFDKRFVFVASLVLGLGMGLTACSDDDDSDSSKECTVNADCKDKAKPVCSADGKCIAKADEGDKKDDGAECKAADECKSGKCEDGKCAAASTGGCKKHADCTDAATPVCNVAGVCVAEKGAACPEDGKCGENEHCDRINSVCVPNKIKLETCGNKTRDDGEFCDKDASGSAIFADDAAATCENYLKADGKDPSLYEYATDGKPGCSSDCNSYAKGNCDAKLKTCGDGNVTGDEKCDVVDGKTVVSDGKGGTREATCEDQSSQKFAAGTYTGTPVCNDSCTGLNEGSCTVNSGGGDTPGEEVNGIKSCKVTKLEPSEDGKNIVATATVSAVEGATLKGAIVCGSAETYGLSISNAKDYLFDVAEDGTMNPERSDLAVGTYKCVVVVQDMNQKDKLDTNTAAICSDSGVVSSGKTLGGTKMTGVSAATEIVLK